MQPAFLDHASPWIDATLASLSPRQRIAQLLHVASWSNRGPEHQAQIVAQIAEHGIGGVIFFQGDPAAQWDCTDAYQRAAQVPLMISIDAEWGLAMRLSRSVQFPYAMTLGAIDDLELIRAMGAELGRHCRRLGVHMNHAPVVDINTEPANPVIGFRSFGSDPHEVARRAEAFVHGMQSERVIAVAKHFPGHGDTKVDSHLSLPVLPHDRARLDAVELVPFRHLIDRGLAAVMTGHLQVPALDPTPNVGATLSSAISHDLLQRELGFAGLVVTDALDMKGVAAHFTPPDISRRALLAGNDVLLFCVDVPGSLDAIEHAVADGRITQAEIDRRCRKLLQAKAWLGLDRFAMPPRDGLLAELNSGHADQLNQRLADASITALRTAAPPDPRRTATLALTAAPAESTDALGHHQLTRIAATSHGPGDRTPFQQVLAEAGIERHLSFALGEDTDDAWRALLASLAAVDEVIVGLHGLNMKASLGFGITEDLCHKLDQLLRTGKASLCVFCNGYAMPRLPDVSRSRRLLLAYQDTPYLERAAARVLTGAAAARGRDHLGLATHCS